MDENQKKPQRRQSEGPSEEHTVQILHEGLNKLDDLFPASPPSSSWFDQQIAETQNKQRLRLRGDLFKLWLVALMLLYILYMTAASQPVTFISFQALAMIVPLVWLLLRKQVDSHE
ncbi:hypothetical protein SAMN04487897_10756 [Paenibacillus sp. yr247]|uniref:YxlC family protein n=1 Tax=Paenibacillus sp. yr247 TaxID=1761880 RepID=UPI000887C906|nr:YxlC family protein [Paenibacillus sp. yr247]SDO00829.1 hypothetical protein SAMN04487897_10756 [Paenibacillus sp. yr247]